MAITLAAAVVFAAVASALSLFLYLPALAVVETLSPRRAKARAAIWLVALVLPIALGALASGMGIDSALRDVYGSPHLTADRPHLCSRWVLTAPDMRAVVTLVGASAIVFVLMAIIRGIVGPLRSMATCRRFRAATSGHGGPIAIPDPAIFLATIGLLRPVTIYTSGTQRALSSEELAGALAHESAHAQRLDNLADLLATFCVMALPFVPTTHLFARYWREEVEMACDDQAAIRSSPEAVASAMAKLAKLSESEAHDRLVAVPTARWRQAASDVRKRANRLLATHARDDAPVDAETPLIGLLLTGAAVAALALGIAATARQAGDTLFCLAESLLAVLR